VSLLRADGFEVISIPDDPNLHFSIDYANRYAQNIADALAIDIHLNYEGLRRKSGTEVYGFAGSPKSIQIADVMARNISQAIGLPNNGGKPDTQAAVGSLGWVRETNCWAVVVEPLYLDNLIDQRLISEGKHELIAQGIVNGVLELFGIPTKKLDTLQISTLDNLLRILKNMLLRFQSKGLGVVQFHDINGRA
jgi:N-acetylmuramoyl-L-alanine amidase